MDTLQHLVAPGGVEEAYEAEVGLVGQAHSLDVQVDPPATQSLSPVHFAPSPATENTLEITN